MRPLLIVLVALAFSCNRSGTPQTTPTLVTGAWRLVLNLGEQSLPFEISLDRNGDDWSATIANAEESIFIDDVIVTADSLVLTMPLFDSDLKGKIENDHTISGLWTNHLRGPEYQIPFVASAGAAPRFEHENSWLDLSGNWEVTFSAGTDDEYPAIGAFEQHGDKVTGTFITETGDYRYLEGVVDGDSLKLSCFDGSHAFLFKAKATDNTLAGTFWSGTHWDEPWHAVRNDSAALTDPDSLTFLKEGYEMIDFLFEDLDGTALSPKNERYADKVLLIQIMGTWCPNCVDETRLLNEAYDLYADQGLEVIALAFEKHKDRAKARTALMRFKEALDVQYPIAHAGHASKDSAALALPFLNHVMSYPTCIMIDRKGMVRKIRTGFYGPGTGDHYTIYKSEFMAFVDELIKE